MLTKILLCAVIALALTLAANFVTTIYLHRGLTHKALSVGKPLSYVFRVATWMFTGIRPRQWVAVHRKHHAFTDEEGDPHSPLRLGWKRVQLTNVSLYRAAAADTSVLDRYAKDLPQTKLDKYLLDHALIGLGLGIVLLWLTGLGPWALLAGGLHFVLYLALSGAVNAVGHTFGSREYENTATNLQWLAMLTWGEGLHNNHHAAPTSAQFSLNRNEYDPAWLFIKAADKLGLLQIRHREVHMKAGQAA